MARISKADLNTPITDGLDEPDAESATADHEAKYAELVYVEPGHFRLGVFDIVREIRRGREMWDVYVGPTLVARRTKLRRAIAYAQEREPRAEVR